MDEIQYPFIKASTALGAYLSLAWIDWLTEAGKVAAALTALAIFAELVWKKVLKPFIHWMKDAD